MPTDGKIQTYGFLDQLSTEQLLELVRADFESSEDGDDALTSRILEVIKEREKTQSTGLLSDADQAWEDFQAYYIPDGEARPLYPMRDSDLMAGSEPTDEPAKPAKRRRGRLVKRLVPLAAVLAVSVSSMVMAQAMGVDVFGALARWTDETFHFVARSAADVDSESENLRQAVQRAFDSCGITMPAPAWYPEKTVLARDIDVIESADGSIVTCGFMYDSKAFLIVVEQYYEKDRISGYTFEKDASDVEEYSSNGRQFYIMSNLSESYATFSDDQTVMVIHGNLSLENIKQIIDSIGE